MGRNELVYPDDKLVEQGYRIALVKRKTLAIKVGVTSEAKASPLFGCNFF